ncbi:MAG: hypothetical protein M1818_001367 [Claussenomyces sp. TS43310]|nr:MAG: hypothetical protein M1818_001367 [Claussenomyces sp. TS43310]
MAQQQLHSSARDSSLLSPKVYDDDVSSLHSDQEEDSEDDEVLIGARSSSDIREHDRQVLLEEEEREEMIRKNERRGSGVVLPGAIKNIFGKAYSSIPLRQQQDYPAIGGEGQEKSERRRQRRSRRMHKRQRLAEDGARGEDSELMYEMEQGGLKDNSSTGDSSETEDSAEIDRRGLRQVLNNEGSRRNRWRKWMFIHLLIVVLFSIFVLVAWRLSIGRRKTTIQPTFSNGTALFAPTTILISLDGFRADFLQRGITPRLKAFIEEGVSPAYMKPSFPSVTFPNHYTLVTGLYPESHGIVGNTFWDSEFQQQFAYTDPSRSMQGKWWDGEPLWVTAEKQGIRTAIHMWPGSEAHIMEPEPSFLDEFNKHEALPNKVHRVLELLDKPGHEDENAAIVDMRPQLIAAYVPNVDVDGHRFGPNSTEIRTTINEVDTMLDQIFVGLEERNLTHVVNVIVVSDHGMATTSTDRLIQLDDIIDMDLIEHVDGWPLYGLRPKDMADLQGLYDKLSSEAASGMNFEVYLRDVNMPERYHFTQNDRIAPLWIVPKVGWAIVTRADFDVEDGKAKGEVYHPRGLHGYDHDHPLMRAIFVARGPAFPHAPNSRVEVFQNIEVYNIVCDTLHLTPNANNGTLRLPLKPIGLHDSENAVPDPEDLPASATSDALVDPGSDSVISISPVEASSAADPNVLPPTMVGVNDPDASAARPVVDDGAETHDDAGKSTKFWGWLQGKLDRLKSWLGGTAGGDGEDEKGKDD